MIHSLRRKRRKRFSSVAAAALASLLALVPLTGAAAADSAASLQLTWNALSPVVQKSGEQFAYLASVSCQSLSGEACADVVIEVPYAADDQHPAAAPIAAWSKSVSAAINGTSVGALTWNDTGASVVVALGTLSPGAQANVSLRVVPPARTTAPGTVWTAAIDVNSSNATGVSGAPIEMRADASFRPAVTKSLTDHAPGARVLTGTKVGYRIAVSDVTGGAIGAVGLSDDHVVRVTDALPAELDFVSCSDDCTVSGQTVRWELDPSRIPTSVSLTASVREDAPIDKVFRNSAEAEFTSLVGETATVTSNSVPAVVADAPDPHDVFGKEAVGNLGDTTPSGLGYITSKRPSSYLLKVTGQPSALEYVIRDPLPCTKKGDTWVSLPRSTDELCAEPAFVVSSVKAHAEGGAVVFPQSVTLHYSDGGSDDFRPDRSGDTFKIPAGKKLSRIDARGSLAAGGGTLVYTLTGAPAAFAAEDRLTNIAAFTIPGQAEGGYLDLSAELASSPYTGAAIGWQKTPPSSTDLTFRHMADLDPTSEGGGFNWSYVGWWPQFFATPEQRTESGAAAVVLPSGFKIAERNTTKLAITEDWGAPGQTRYILSGRDANVTGAGGPPFNVVIDRLNPPAPGIHTYEMFVGFRDDTFDQCLLMNGEPEASNSLITDTSGIIGSTDGVETSLCHLQGTLLVLGDDPGVALSNSVRTSLSPQWTSAPETVVEIGDDDAVEFLLAWSNPGSVPVDDAVVYDLFARGEDDRTVAGGLRGSSLPLTLVELPEIPEGWAAEYSTSADPCRPEIRSAKSEIGCTDDWTRDVADIAEATGIRLVKSEPADIGDTLLVTLRFAAPKVDAAVAYNTGATSVGIAREGRSLIPLAPLETPRVGAQRVLADPVPGPSPTPEEPKGEADPGTDEPKGETDPGTDEPKGETDPDDARSLPDDLARTGLDGWGVLLTFGVLLVVAGGVVVVVRRLKPRR